MIDIKDTQGNILLTVPVTENCVYHEELMKAYYVRLSWSSDTNDMIPAGSYIEYNEKKYLLLEPYSPVQKSAFEYTYNIDFQDNIMLWDKKILFFYQQEGDKIVGLETDWSLTDTPAVVLGYIVDAIKRETGEELELHIDDALNASVSMSFQSTSIWGALNQLANICNTEWWMKDNKLYLAKCSYNDPITLEVDKNIGIPSVTANREGYYTRFYAFGSTRNITNDYKGGQSTNHIVQKRLALSKEKYPGGYKDIREGMEKDEIFIKTLVFNDIYPSCDYTISNVRPLMKYVLDGNGNKVNLGTDEAPEYDMYSVWFFRIENFTYDVNKIIPGKVLSVHFQTNQLQGREFELIPHEKEETILDANGTPFLIYPGDLEIKYDESSGFIIPGVTSLCPTEGDEIILFNIEMSDNYIEAAEEALENAMIDEMNRSTSDYNIYKFASNPVVFIEKGIDIHVGQAVNYVNGDYSYTTRVLSVEKKLDYPCCQDITIGEEKIVGNTQQLKEEVVNINKNVDVIKAMNDLSVSVQNSYAHVQEQLKESLAQWGNMWEWDKSLDMTPHKTDYSKWLIKTTYGLYSEKSVSAGGYSPSGTSGGGGLDEVLMWSILGDGDNPSSQIALSHLVLMQNWVNDKGYLTLSSLNEYAQISWVNKELNKYATVSDFNISLTTKVDKAEGMGLSQNSFTNLLLNKLNGIAEGANKYVLPVAKVAVLGGVMIGSTLSASASGVLDLKSNIVAVGTYPKVTVDTYGRVTSGTSLLASDIPSLSISKITGLQNALDSKVDVSFFAKLLSAMDADGNEISVNDMDTTVKNIKAKFGLWTDYFMSAKGMSIGTGGGGGIDETLLWQILSNTGTEQISSTHLSTALSGYALKNGTGATGTWNIGITGASQSIWNDTANMKFHYASQVNNPTFLWGSSDSSNAYLYQPTKMWVGKSYYQIVQDIRDTTKTPNECEPYSITAWFNHSDTPEATTFWYSGITVKGWGDNYRVWQLASRSETTTANPPLYFRNGLGSSWNSWREILDSVNYTNYTVQKNGTGATGTWNINISGSSNISNSILINQRNLIGTIYGNWGGFLQDNTDGPNDNEWSNRIKILHGNTNGFYTELAQQFSGEEALYHRSMRDGTLSRWIRVLDDSNYTNYVVPKSGGTFTGNITASKSIISPDSKINDIYNAVFDSNNAGLQRYIVIELPVGFISSMNIYEIYIYEYSSNAASKLTIGGYNYSGNNSWINSGIIKQGSYGGPVQLGYNPTTSKCCIILGGWDYVWAYPKVFLKTVLTGYGNLDKYTTGYRIYNETNIDSYTNKVLLSSSKGRFSDVYAEGYLYATSNGKTIKIGSQNTSYCHYETTADTHYFNKSLEIKGDVRPYLNGGANIGIASVRWNNIYSKEGDFTGRVRTSNVFSAGESIDDSYGFVNVCRPATINNASCFSWVREGNIAFGLGFDNANRIILGNATTSKTIDRWFTIGSSSVIAKGYAIDGLNDNYVVLGGGGSISKSTSVVNNTIVQRDESGNIFTKYINCSSGNSEQSIAAQFLTLNGSDNWVRKSSAKQVNTYLDNWQNYQDVIDLTPSKYDVNKWYPCSVNIGQGRLITFNIWNSLGNDSHPSWATHSGGFTLNLKWTVVGSGWGTTAVQRTIYNSYYNFTANSMNPCGGIEQNTMASTEIVYLRGGGRYFYNISNGATFVVNDTGYTWTNPNGNYSAPVVSEPRNVPLWQSIDSLIGVSSIYTKYIDCNTNGIFRGTLTANGAVTFTNTLTVNSTTILKGATSINNTLMVAGNIIGELNIFPSVDNRGLLGTGSKSWRELHSYDAYFYGILRAPDTEVDRSLLVGRDSTTITDTGTAPLTVIDSSWDMQLMIDKQTIQIAGGGGDFESNFALRINPLGGRLELGNTNTISGKSTVFINVNSDIPSSPSLTNYFAIGRANNMLSFWYDGIQAHSGTSTATLYLNYGGGNIILGNSGSLTTTDGTMAVRSSATSTSYSTGALVVVGGVGIGGDIFSNGSYLKQTANKDFTIQKKMFSTNIYSSIGLFNAVASNGEFNNIAMNIQTGGSVQFDCSGNTFLWIGNGKVQTSGNIIANGSVAAKNVSDERLKTNFVQNIRYDEKLLLLGNVLDYNYNETAIKRGTGGVDRQRHTGLIYQNVKDVLPQMVSVSDDGYGALNYISPDFICLIAGATQLNTIGLKDVLRRTKTVEEEVKELKEENMQLKKRIIHLEGRFV